MYVNYYLFIYLFALFVYKFTFHLVYLQVVRWFTDIYAVF